MEEAILNVVVTINSYLSNYVLIILLLGMGIWFTVRTKFIQFRCFGEGWRRLFGDFSLRGGNQGGAMTSFQALATADARPRWEPATSLAPAAPSSSAARVPYSGCGS